MAHKDHEVRKRYERERRRRIRAAERTPATLVVPEPVRLEMVAGVQALLVEAVTLVRTDPGARGVEKARALGYLASIGLRLIEAHNLADRLEAMEHLLEQRRQA
jgi:hypothetical protein